MKLKQIMILVMFTVQMVFSSTLFAKEDAPNGIVDDSIRDMSIVFGSGAAGAILGLSTLSFVDEPSKHTRNIAVGGAIGIVLGVAAVIFYQASKTTISNVQHELPLTAEQFASFSKKEFQESRAISEKKEVMNQSDALRILLPF